MFSRFIDKWQPSQDELIQPLLRPKRGHLRLHRFPLGIDNVHIDVGLAAKLQRALSILVAEHLNDEVTRSIWHKRTRPPGAELEASFRDLYGAAMRNILEKGRVEARIEQIQLYQLAVLNLLLLQLDREVAKLRHDMQEARASHKSGKGLQIHEQLVALARGQEGARSRTASRLMRILLRIENGSLKRVRKSVINLTWPIPEYWLTNPLLQLGGLGPEDEFSVFYPLVLRDAKTLHLLNKGLEDLLRPWLPKHTAAPFDVSQLPDIPDCESVPGMEACAPLASATIDVGELDTGQVSWLDIPENLVQLLGGLDPEELIVGPWRDPRWPKFQKHLAKQALDILSHHGQLRAVAASYALNEIEQNNLMPGLRRLQYDLLTERINRKEFERRLASLECKSIPAQVQTMDAVHKSIRAMNGEDRRVMAVRLFRDLLRLRRDLKSLWRLGDGLAKVRVLEDEQHTSLSRANGLLQDFTRLTRDIGDEEDETARPVGHVIIKADVRGSTRITHEMRAKGLNPAAYFGQNFYAPINELLKRYGAEKVFVEGDAVILMLQEFEQSGQGGYAVARACGLARKMVQVVEAKNVLNARNDLPLLELGIGIAYVDEPPTYLYDDDHRIIISPAINRADRLSSCHKMLRQLNPRPDTRGRGVLVATRPQHNDWIAPDEEGQFHYNVNGIELSVPAYDRLCQEIRLHQVVDANGDSREKFYLGKFPDQKDELHWLAIRELPIYYWIGQELTPGPNQGPFFFEVLGDVQKIRSLVTEGRSVAMAGSQLSVPADSVSQM